MRQLLKTLYEFKIRTMFYFQLGYGEVSSTASMIKDIAILLGFAVIVFKIQLSLRETLLISAVTFLIFILIGVILKKTGMSDFTTRMSNSVNPELKLVRKIAKHLGVEEDGE